MNRRLATVANSQSGAFSAADAARVGVSSDELTTLARHREIVRIRRGAYVLASVYTPAHPSERYALEVKAVLRTRSLEDRAAYHSALAVLGIETHGVPARLIAVESKSIRRQAVRARLAKHPWSGGDTWVSRDYSTVTPAMACVQVAARYGFEAGLCAVDSALRQGRCTMTDLETAVELLPPLKRTLALTVLAAADATAESVGETRTRIVLVDAGFDVRSQVVCEDGLGFVGRVDFLVDDLVIVEFDGLKKYAGATGQDALAAEKAREERLSGLGYEVVRVVWSELEDPVALVHRITRARLVALQRRRAVSVVRV